MSGEIVDSIKEHLKKRLTTPVYGTFTALWVIFHWQFLVTLFFVSEEKIWSKTGLLKNEYIGQFFFVSNDWHSYFRWIAPIVLTWLFIWVLPRWVFIPAFRKEEEDRTSKMRIRITEEQKLQQAETSLETQKVKKVEAVEKKAEIEKTIKKIDPTIGWQKEFDLLKTNSSDLAAIQNAIRVVYQTAGEYTTSNRYSDERTTFIIPDFVSRVDTLGLVDITEGSYGQKMSFTEKGKFFVRKLQEQN